MQRRNYEFMQKEKVSAGVSAGRWVCPLPTSDSSNGKDHSTMSFASAWDASVGDHKRTDVVDILNLLVLHKAAPMTKQHPQLRRHWRWQPRMAQQKNGPTMFLTLETTTARLRQSEEAGLDRTFPAPSFVCMALIQGGYTFFIRGYTFY